MKVNIISVGKLREKYLIEAAAEYSKRISRFCNLQSIYITDIKISEKASDLDCKKNLADEGNAILKKIKNGTIIALCIEGIAVTSEDMAALLSSFAMMGGEITFVIGSSLGLSPQVKERADKCISMSKMTFPHQIARIILLEQIYRGFKINANEVYHK